MTSAGGNRSVCGSSIVVEETLLIRYIDSREERAAASLSCLRIVLNCYSRGSRSTCRLDFLNKSNSRPGRIAYKHAVSLRKQKATRVARRDEARSEARPSEARRDGTGRDETKRGETRREETAQRLTEDEGGTRRFIMLASKLRSK